MKLDTAKNFIHIYIFNKAANKGANPDMTKDSQNIIDKINSLAYFSQVLD
jgi:hypothetical protein